MTAWPKRKWLPAAAVVLVLALLGGLAYVRWKKGTRRYTAQQLTQYRLREYRQAERERRELDMAALRELITAADPRLRGVTDPLEIAILLRDHVYQRIPRKKTASNFPFHRPLESYVKSTIDSQYGHVCGGLAILYRTVLTAFGIYSRQVGLYSREVAPFDSHASVEVFIGGRWIASDPTFNVMFRAGDRFLGFEEIRAMLLAGREVTTTTNGMSEKPELPTLATYYVPLRQLVNYLYIEAATVKSGERRLEFAPVILPEGWDADLDYEDSSRRDLAVSTGEYFEELRQGVFIK